MMTIRTAALWLLVSAAICVQCISFEAFHNESLPLLSLTNHSDENLLLPFNTTRTPDSKESLRVQSFIRQFYRNLQGPWHFEEDHFEANGHRFTNLVFTLGEASSYVVVAAHYDSKLTPKGFVGGTDSAVPCGILLYISRFLDRLYDEDAALLEPLLRGKPVGYKIVFFDGEEALQEWAPEDSLYGSRHLAAQWENDGAMGDVDLLVLLDLLGGEPHPIKSYFRETHSLYECLAGLEAKYPGPQQLDPSDHSFLQLNGITIEDDHLPFYEAGVHVLHLIPWPFPSVWHTARDDFHHLNQRQIDKWAVLLSEFLVECSRRV